MALLVQGLMSKIKFLDVLDCVACYCRCDPLKTGVINSSAVISLLSQKINDISNFGQGIKLKKNWRVWHFINLYLLLYIYHGILGNGDFWQDEECSCIKN